MFDLNCLNHLNNVLEETSFRKCHKFTCTTNRDCKIVITLEPNFRSLPTRSRLHYDLQANVYQTYNFVRFQDYLLFGEHPSVFLCYSCYIYVQSQFTVQFSVQLRIKQVKLHVQLDFDLVSIRIDAPINKSQRQSKGHQTNEIISKHTCTQA